MQTYYVDRTRMITKRMKIVIHVNSTTQKQQQE